jgi:uncharacterized membrane protein HdeD (DUF308 family)
MVDSTTASFETRDRPWWLILVEGILALVIGILILTSPRETVFYLVMFLGVYWVVKGIFDIISMFVDHTAWGWKLFTGLLGIIAGLIILRNPVLSGLAIPGLFVWLGGLYCIIGGIVLFVQAFRGGGWGAGILGVLLIVLGIIILGNTLVSTVTFIWIAGILLIVGGIAAIVQAFQQRS